MIISQGHIYTQLSAFMDRTRNIQRHQHLTHRYKTFDSSQSSMTTTVKQKKTNMNKEK
jgi:hypothetical protein